MLLAPALGDAPRSIAERLGQELGQRLGASVDRVEVAGPGFLNLFMSDAWYLDALGGDRGRRRAVRRGRGGASPST